MRSYICIPGYFIIAELICRKTNLEMQKASVIQELALQQHPLHLQYLLAVPLNFSAK